MHWEMCVKYLLGTVNCAYDFLIWNKYCESCEREPTSSYLGLKKKKKKKKKYRVSTNMPKNIRIGRSEILFLFADLRAKLPLGAHISTK